MKILVGEVNRGEEGGRRENEGGERESGKEGEMEGGKENESVASERARAREIISFLVHIGDNTETESSGDDDELSQGTEDIGEGEGEGEGRRERETEKEKGENEKGEREEKESGQSQMYLKYELFCRWFDGKGMRICVTFIFIYLRLSINFSEKITAFFYTKM